MPFYGTQKFDPKLIIGQIVVLQTLFLKSSLPSWGDTNLVDTFLPFDSIFQPFSSSETSMILSIYQNEVNWS